MRFNIDAGLVMHQQLILDNQSGKAGQWRAVCTIGGQEYEAIAGSGAPPRALARQLLAAGVADGPVVVITEPAIVDGKPRYLGGEITYPSLHWLGRHAVASATPTTLPRRPRLQRPVS
jgi:hypothetical protein